MLASITPLGERGRGRSYIGTSTAFLVGAVGAGSLCGAACGGAGALLLPSGTGTSWRLALLACALAGALLIDLRRGGIPGPRRQVDERWLDQYRGWVYGLGYGAQLGLGVTTIVTSAATYAALVAALLSGSALAGTLVMGTFGLLRGLTPLVSVRVRDPAALVRHHRRLDALYSPVRGGLNVWMLALAAAAAALAAT